MKQSSLRPVGLFLVGFVFTLFTPFAFTPFAFAQTNSNPLVGTWRTSLELGQGWPAATGVFQAQPDGRYREEMYVQNQLAAFWEGTYTLSPDGTFTQTETNKSPQLCLQGQCVPNDGPGVNVSQVNVQSPDVFTVTAQDPASGQALTLTWQRVSGTDPANPTAQLPQTPQALSPQPGQSPIVGSWQFAEQTSAGHTIVTVFIYTADGRFNVQNLLNGQSLMSSYGGAYSLLPDGTYYENTTEKSDMYCYLQCQPNPAQLGNAGPLSVSFPDANTLTFTDSRGSYSITRAQSGGVPSAGTPAAPCPTPCPIQCRTPRPTQVSTLPIIRERAPTQETLSVARFGKSRLKSTRIPALRSTFRSSPTPARRTTTLAATS